MGFLHPYPWEVCDIKQDSFLWTKASDSALSQQLPRLLAARVISVSNRGGVPPCPRRLISCTTQMALYNKSVPSGNSFFRILVGFISGNPTRVMECFVTLSSVTGLRTAPVTSPHLPLYITSAHSRHLFLPDTVAQVLTPERL